MYMYIYVYILCVCVYHASTPCSLWYISPLPFNIEGQLLLTQPFLFGIIPRNRPPAPPLRWYAYLLPVLMPLPLWYVGVVVIDPAADR